MSLAIPSRAHTPGHSLAPRQTETPHLARKRLHPGKDRSGLRSQASPTPAESYPILRGPPHSCAHRLSRHSRYAKFDRLQVPSTSPRGCRQESPEFAPLLSRKCGLNHISHDLSLSSKKIEDVVRFSFHWDKHRHRLGAVGYLYRHTLSLDFVHYLQTICLKRSGRHFLHRSLRYNYGHHTIVISASFDTPPSSDNSRC